jgi:DNA-binding transcriptional LysR family regulator
MALRILQNYVKISSRSIAMSLNLRDLEYFYQLSKLRSFTNVAKHFRVSQPTISYAIKRLETYYDCDLFYKDSSHQVVDLTPEGELLAMRTNEILSELNHTKKSYSSFEYERF